MKKNLRIICITICTEMIVSIFATMLWNWIMPYLFNLPIISYWMMFGLTVLINILTPITITNKSK